MEITPEQSSLSLTTSLRLFITQMHDRGFGLIGPHQVHAEYKMHTCRTINTLVQHGVWRQAYPRNTDATCTVRWQTWWRRGLGMQLTPVSQSPTVPFEQWDRAGLRYDRFDWSSRVGGCGLLARADSRDVACLLVFWCSWLHFGRMQYVERGWIT